MVVTPTLVAIYMLIGSVIAAIADHINTENIMKIMAKADDREACADMLHQSAVTAVLGQVSFVMVWPFALLLALILLIVKREITITFEVTKN